MPRGQNLGKARQPREVRARLLGVKLLRPEEAARNIWVRGEKAVIGAFNRLSAEERGEVVKAGLEALGVWKEGQDGEAQAGK